jgi:flagellar biosynthesis/type III secretory pathway protein FliH
MQKGLEVGLQEGMEKGLQKGMQQGMQQILLRLLRQRFEALPPNVARRISAIRSTEELERLADRVLVASSLEELGLA